MAETPTTNNRRPKTDAARQHQRDGQYKGLLHAAQKRKADNSANYATNFKHGQTAFDFERSAEAAGETREEVRGHLSLLDRTLLTLCGFFPRLGKALSGAESRSLPIVDCRLPIEGAQVVASVFGTRDPELPIEEQAGFNGQSAIDNRQLGGEGPGVRGQTPDTVGDCVADESSLPLRTDAKSPRAPKLVRALALLLWRPLRLYRNQENWERLAICYLLQRIIRWRKQHGNLTVEIAEKFHWDLDAILENYYSHINPRLKKIERRLWKVWRLYRGLVGVVTVVFGKLPIANCRLAIEEAQAEAESPINSHDSQIDNCESTIENRQSLVQFRGTPHYDQFHPTWLERIDDSSPEAIGNPFQSPSHALKGQQRSSQPAAVKDPAEWQQHPPKPRRPEMEACEEFSELPPSAFRRTPSERELRRLVRRGELTVPGSFEEFAKLVEQALGTRDSELPIAECRLPIEEPPGANRKSTIENQQSVQSAIANRQSTIALAESLWNRMHAFSSRVSELRDLLEATLLWQPHRFLPLWKKLLPVEYGYGAVDFFQQTHGANREDIAWGDDETTLPWHEGKLRPAERPRSEAEERKVHAGELQHALRIWLHAVWHALVPVLRGSHKVTVALYDWAVSRFGIREEFLRWRPNLSLAQLDTRHDRPEWAVRVTTVTGKTLVKLSDGRMFEP
jgi:hypothetical protein